MVTNRTYWDGKYDQQHDLKWKKNSNNYHGITQWSGNWNYNGNYYKPMEANDWCFGMFYHMSYPHDATQHLYSSRDRVEDTTLLRRSSSRVGGALAEIQLLNSATPRQAEDSARPRDDLKHHETGVG